MDILSIQAMRKKDASCYKITELFEKATKTKITWKMENCHQQSGTWECGYYVMYAMYDFFDDLQRTSCKYICIFISFI
ncbi:putative papain-like cysteine peptidase superfamily [Helianthus anomalus]